MTNVVRFDRLGGPEVLRVEDIDIGAPGAGEVRLRMEAIGLNRAEALYREGRYIYQPVFPSMIGYEGAGVVEAIGPGIEGYQQGDAVSVMPVFAMNRYGVFGEQAIVPVEALASIPAGLSFEEASAIWMPLLTAYGALVQDSGLRPGDSVLLTAGSSSVALAAIQIAKREGLTAIVSTRTSAKRDALLAAGADHVIVASEQNLPAKVARLTGGRGAKLVFDPVNGPGLDELAEATAPDGKVLVYGSLDSRPGPFQLFPPVEGGHPLPNGGRIRFYTMHEVIGEPTRFAAAKAYILDGIASGAFRPQVGKVFPFPSAVEAYAYQEANAQIGKIVVRVKR